MKFNYVIKSVSIIGMAVLMALALGIAHTPVQKIAAIEEEIIELEATDAGTTQDSTELLKGNEQQTDFGAAQVSTEIDEERTDEELPYYNDPSFYDDNEAGIDVPTDNMGEDGTNYSEEANGRYVDGYNVPSCAIDPRDYNGKIYGTPSRGTEGGYNPVPHLITKVPNVIGMQYEDALRTLRSVGLRTGVNSGSEPFYMPNAAPRGTILCQNIPAGAYAWLEEYVDTRVSSGIAPYYYVPDVNGMTQDRALAEFENYGLPVPEIIYTSGYDNVPDMTVVSQSPQYFVGEEPASLWDHGHYVTIEDVFCIVVYKNIFTTYFNRDDYIRCDIQKLRDAVNNQIVEVIEENTDPSGTVLGITLSNYRGEYISEDCVITAYISSGPTPTPTPEQTPETSPDGE